MIVTLFIIGSLILGYNIFKPSWRWGDVSDYFLMFFMSLLMGAMGGMFSGLLGLILNNTILPPQITKTQDAKIEIYSLVSKQDISGSFALGSGYVGSQENYYTFTKNEKGGFEREVFPSHHTTLYMEDSSNPRVEWVVSTYTPSKWIVFPWPVDFSWTEDSRYNMYVPQNTVVQKFEIN